jgi:DNA/RNA-binding domain of Phe-tRNA-synthetase-like protein
MTNIAVDDHPLLRIAAFVTLFPAPIGEMESPASTLALLAAQPDPAAAELPFGREESVRSAVRDMLRIGGYKPTGRGKPASEYLLRAATEGQLGSINVAVDACNAVSLHSGLPISVVDLDRATAPFRISIPATAERYIFNASGQEIDVTGLACLFDAVGPCANAVRDSQRTKTDPGTTRTLSVVWGVAGHEERLARATDSYLALLRRIGAGCEPASVG